MHHIKIKASPLQLSKLRNGHKVRITKGEGCNLIVHPETYSIVSRAFAKNKGINVSLSPQELEANKQYSYLSPEQHAQVRGDKTNPFSELPFHEGKGLYKSKGGKISPVVMKGLESVGNKYGEKIADAVINKAIDKALGSGVNSSLLKVQGGLNKIGTPFEKSVGVNPATLGFDLGNEVIGPAIYESIYGHPRGYGLSSYRAMQEAGMEYANANRATDLMQQAGIHARRALAPYQHYLHDPLEPRSRGQGTGSPNINGRNQLIGFHQNPALVSQPLSANFQMQHFLPPQYQSHFLTGGGLYT